MPSVDTQASEPVDAAEAERRREEAAQRRKDFDDGLARQRREVDELAASFEGMKETLSSLQTQRRERMESGMRLDMFDNKGNYTRKV